MVIDLTKKDLSIVPMKDKVVLPVDFATGVGGGAKPEDRATRTQTFYQNSAPTGDYKAGDIWVDTDDDNKTYRANESYAWVSIQDGTIAGKISTFIQASAPTATATGDLWFDSDDENKVYRWSGSAWVSAQDLAASWALITGAAKPEDNADVTGSHQADVELINIGEGSVARYNVLNALTSGEAIAVKKAVYIKSSDVKVWKTDATDYTKVEGFVGFQEIAATGADESKDVQTAGKVSGFSGLTSGKNYFLAQVGTTDANISETWPDGIAATWSVNAKVIAYKFTVSNRTKLSDIVVKISKTGSPGTLTALLKKGAPTGNAPAGNEPTIATPTGSPAITTSEQSITYDFDELILEPDTYYLVFYVSAGTHDASNYYTFHRIDAGGGTRLSYVSSGDAWVFNIATYIQVNYLEDAVTYATGDITDYFYTYPKIAGIAVSATELFILSNDNRVGNGALTISAIGLTTVTIGFRPKKVTIFANYGATSSQGSRTVSGTASTISTGAASSISTALIWSLSGGSGGIVVLTDTGFQIICTTYTATSHLMWTCEG